MADLLAKHTAEVGRILEADLGGHFGNAILSVAQQILSLLDPVAAQIIPRCYSKLVLENATQIILANADCAGDLLARDLVCEMLLHIGHRASHQRAGALR